MRTRTRPVIVASFNLQLDTHPCKSKSTSETASVDTAIIAGGSGLGVARMRQFSSHSALTYFALSRPNQALA